MAILIDASVFCAYANSRDVHYKNAKKIMEDIIAGVYGSGILTDYIFDETVNVIERRTDKKNSVEVGNFLLNSEILLSKVDALSFERAWELFQTSEGQSFTDCTSAAFMQIFEIEKIATFDQGFKKIKGITVVEN